MPIGGVGMIEAFDGIGDVWGCVSFLQKWADKHTRANAYSGEPLEEV